MKQTLRKILKNFKYLLAIMVASLGAYYDINADILELLEANEFQYKILLFLAEVGFVLGLIGLSKWAFKLLREEQKKYHFGTSYDKKMAERVDAHLQRKRFPNRKRYVEALIKRDLKT